MPSSPNEVDDGVTERKEALTHRPARRQCPTAVHDAVSTQITGRRAAGGMSSRWCMRRAEGSGQTRELGDTDPGQLYLSPLANSAPVRSCAWWGYTWMPMANNLGYFSPFVSRMRQAPSQSKAPQTEHTEPGTVENRCRADRLPLSS